MRAPSRAVAHTVEDAEGLLNSLLLLTVLMLAFAVNQTTAIFSLEDYILADQREALSYWNTRGRPEIIENGPWGRGTLSHSFIVMGYWSILWLVAALVLGASSYQPVLLRRTRIAGIPETVVEGAPLGHGTCMACLPCRHVLLPPCDACRGGYCSTEVPDFHGRERDARTRFA